MIQKTGGRSDSNRFGDICLMGTKFLFKCDKCSYEDELSDGKDYGFVVVIETMKCIDCEEMVEVLIGARGKEGKTGDPGIDKGLDICPKCRGSNIAKWDNRRSCPKCDGQMKKGEATLLWD